MLDRIKHETTMRNILDSIYNDAYLSNKLGFKGGTCGYFFYGLPRFSTDLDFNLLSQGEETQVFDSLKILLKKHGEVADAYIKLNTIFFYVVHTPQKSGIKIEISTREIENVNSYELKEFYGTSFLVMKKEDLFANKLIALTKRISPSSRDLFDIDFFFSKGWSINEKIITEVTGGKFIEYLQMLPSFIEKNFNASNIHLGLGELLSKQSERDYVRKKLIDDTINRIQFFISRHTSGSP
jgi:predicted nucleotidyltransferase component of viral defense system